MIAHVIKTVVALAVLLIVSGCTGQSEPKNPTDAVQQYQDYQKRSTDFGTFAGIVAPRFSTTHHFPLAVFPKPYQGPVNISKYCWPATNSTHLTWGTVEDRLKTAFEAVGLNATVYDLHNDGFVLISEMQFVNEDGNTSTEKTDTKRQFIAVFTNDTLDTDDNLAYEQQFQSYHDKGSPELSNSLAANPVSPSERGDRVYLLVYKFSRKPYVKDYSIVAEEHHINHIVASGLQKQFDKLTEAYPTTQGK